MKKIVSYILAAIWFFLRRRAGESDAPADAAFEGSWVQFEDGFEIYLPSDWLVVDPRDEMLESGVFYAVTSPDGARSMQVAWAEEAGASTRTRSKSSWKPPIRMYRF